MNKKMIVPALGLSAAVACAGAAGPTRNSLVSAFEKGFIKGSVEVLGRNEYGQTTQGVTVRRIDKRTSVAVLAYSVAGGTARQDFRFLILEADAYPLEAGSGPAVPGVKGVGRIFYRLTKVTRLPDGTVSPETVIEEEQFALFTEKDKIWSFRNDEWVRQLYSAILNARAKGPKT